MAASGAAFTLGHEAVIPEMFEVIVRDLQTQFPQPLDLLQEYLERHIALDGEQHTPMVLQMLSELCGDDCQKWQEAEQAAQVALQTRIALWDGAITQIVMHKS